MDFKNLNRYRVGGTSKNMKLNIPVPKTPDGRYYRYSPNADAHPRHFVLGGYDPEFVITPEARARMKHDPRTKNSVCPYSGVVATDDDFLHPDDRKAAIATFKDAAIRDVEDAFKNIFKGLNSKHIKTSFRASSPRPKPRFARRDLLRELVCDQCSRDYGVFAISLYCHDCGAPNLRLHFKREVELVKQQVELATVQSGEATELSYRLLGNAHEDVLTAFEATQKAVYLYGKVQAKTLREEIKPVGNDFQNVERAQKRFAELGLDPYASLETEALETLKLNIQKRHIIGHNLGVMDQKFASQAGNVKVGETVRLVASDVIEFAESCQSIVNGLDNWLIGSKESPEMIDVSKSVPLPAKAPDAEAALDLGLGLSPLAQDVGIWIAKGSDNGLTHGFIKEDGLLAAFPDHKDAMTEALAELEVEGYVTAVRHFGGDLPYIKPTVDLFTAFDKYALGNDPYEDAADLIERILAGKDQVASAELHKETGWPQRRFNPALAIILPRIDDGRVSKELTSDYPSNYFFMIATDRVELKRLLKEIKA
jgi:hypothetical protein